MAMMQDRPLLFLVGIITVIAGLAIVLVHNVWSGGAAPVIFTLFGCVILLKGLLSLFFAPEMIVSMVDRLRFEEYFYAYAAAPLTYTSLGLGDLVPTHDMRMLVGAEVLNGLVMIGWTISFTYLTMEKFWQQPELEQGKR